MKSFHFSLQRVLDWRTLQLRAEEEKLAALAQQLASLIHREQSLNAAQRKSESGVLESAVIGGADLRALAGFQLRIRTERESLRAGRAQCEAQIAEQRKRLVRAHQDCRLLEKLKEKRLTAWTYLSARELEDTAAESYISRWLRANEGI